MITRAPWRATPTAVAAPNPVAAPVTRTFRPSKPAIAFPSGSFGSELMARTSGRQRRWAVHIGFQSRINEGVGGRGNAVFAAQSYHLSGQPGHFQPFAADQVRRR